MVLPFVGVPLGYETTSKVRPVRPDTTPEDRADVKLNAVEPLEEKLVVTLILPTKLAYPECMVKVFVPVLNVVLVAAKLGG